MQQGSKLMPYKDPEARRANARAYREKNRITIAAYLGAWRAEHKEERKQKDRTYRDNHRAEYSAYEKERAKKPERYEVWKAAKKKWLTNNPQKTSEYRNRWLSRPEGKVVRARSNRSYELRKQHQRESALGRPKPNVCEACGRAPNSRGIVFDHCHEHGHPRGWLCWTCNVVLGHLEDDPNRLLKLVVYLKRTSRKPADQFALPGL
jgi:hypothetical protein